jgi:hypothetical protein
VDEVEEKMPLTSAAMTASFSTCDQFSRNLVKGRKGANGNIFRLMHVMII